MNAYDIIKKPLMSEKISALNEQKIYCFKVSRLATKIDIKKALKEMFGIEVDEVRLVNIPGKVKFLRKGPAEKRTAFRKAYITLRNKAKLDLNKLAKEEKEDLKVTVKPAGAIKAATARKAASPKKVTEKKAPAKKSEKAPKK